MLTVSYDDEKIMHTSDIQGPIDELALTEILSENPRLLAVGGPPLYLSGATVKEDLIIRGRENFTKICEKTPISIIDHHLLRSADWRTFIEPAVEAANSRGNRVFSAAEYRDLPNRLLECRRGELYEQDPPSHEFKEWTKLPKDRRRVEPPPV
jgi:predicted metallo-beta-lactamase superfamily hydrolase